MQELVAVQRVADVGMVERTPQPFPAVERNLDGEGKPRLQTDAAGAVVGVIEVEVEMLAA